VARVTPTSFPGPERFRPHIGSDFTIDDRGQRVVLRLAHVADGGFANGMHQFSLIFHGPADRVLPGAIHALSHPSIGTLDIFLTPVVGSNASRTVYQACFSQPTSSAPESGK
jgi:uncharacterized protein DUF6916